MPAAAAAKADKPADKCKDKEKYQFHRFKVAAYWNQLSTEMKEEKQQTKLEEDRKNRGTEGKKREKWKIGKGEKVRKKG